MQEGEGIKNRGEGDAWSTADVAKKGKKGCQVVLGHLFVWNLECGIWVFLIPYLGM